MERYSPYRWFVLVSLVVITSVSAMLMIAPAPLVGLVAEEHGTSLGGATAETMMVFMLVTCVVAFASAHVIDRVGFSRLWAIGLAIQIAGSLMVPVLGHSMAGLVAARVIQGIGNGPINAVIASVGVQWFKPKERGYVASAQGVSMWIGISLGELWTPHWLDASGSWTTAMQMSAIPSGVGLLFAVVVVFGPRATHQIDVTTAIERAASQRDWKRALVTVTVWALFGMAFFEAWYQQAYNSMALGFYSVETPTGVGLGAVRAGQALSWAGYASILGTIAAPFVTQNLFKDKPAVPLAIACLVSGAATIGMHHVTADSGALLTVFPCVMLFFSSMVNPTIYGYIQNHFPPTMSGRLGATTTSIAGMGAFAGLAVGSWTLAATRAYTVSMNIVMAVIIISGILAAFLRDPGMRKASEPVEPCTVESSAVPMR